MTISTETVLTFLTILAGAVFNWWANSNKIKELQQAQMALENKLKHDDENAEQSKKENDAKLAEHFLEIAKQSGLEVIEKIETIKELRKRVECLEKEKKELQAEIDDLRNRLKALEDKSNGTEEKNAE